MADLYAMVVGTQETPQDSWFSAEVEGKLAESPATTIGDLIQKCVVEANTAGMERDDALRLDAARTFIQRSDGYSVNAYKGKETVSVEQSTPAAQYFQTEKRGTVEIAVLRLGLGRKGDKGGYTL